MSAQRRKIARRLEKSPSLKRELSEMAVESYGDAVLSAAREKREGIKLMGQKFFDMHESSRLNMSFKCSGVFNIIYIMRTNVR
ncbi:DUF29 family protein [Salmonella enterica subsp. enterica serovar Kentucky]|nr:DUF29 family protein [Salmonella enterica subsp. enterica serovar Kentucky]ECT3450873.1 DUF29 family protein [Salmonella enterica subsp. enterica serovar Kentucky]MKW71084.1 DUF29 family protein [Salmonella enterica subsp. enterica serovar Kentucky]